jgi:hypothetical protein
LIAGVVGNVLGCVFLRALIAGSERSKSNGDCERRSDFHGFPLILQRSRAKALGACNGSVMSLAWPQD